MQEHSPYVRFATLYENKAVITYEPIDGKRWNFTPSEYHKKPTNQRYTGKLSKHAQKQIDKRLHGWVYSMLTARSNRKGLKRTTKRKPIFVTLTLPSAQRHDDKTIKSKVLELFIKRLQYNHNVRHYFWRAEVQENGNIHFHLIFDRFIKKDSLSSHWNECLENLNYITEFEKKHGHRNPPTTNVKKLWNGKANIWYLLKYVGKEHKGRLIKGALFRFSQSLKDIKPLKIILDYQDAKKLRAYCANQVQSVFESDFFAVVNFKRSRSLLPFFNTLGESFLEVANYCFELLYPPDDNPQPALVLLATKPKPIAQQLYFNAFTN